jgi:predicted DNA binding protein
MLRLEFQMPLAGVLETLVEAIEPAERAETDNLVPMGDGRAMAFVTLTCSEPTDVRDLLVDRDVAVEHAGATGDAATYHLVLDVDLDASVLSTVVGEGVVPHRFVADGDRIDGVVSVEDWNHLRDLAAAIETEYGVFDLRGTTELDRPGYPLGRDRFAYGVRGKLTADQLDVLRTAYEMGHFAVPQQATSEEVAEALDIGRSTLSERLRRAENDLLRTLFSGPE